MMRPIPHLVRFLALSAFVALAVVSVTTLKAEDPLPPDETEKPKESKLTEHVVVTATRSEESTFDVPQPVSVVTAEEIREAQPDTATDLLRELPGVDVNGIGTNQPRPIIRGQRGQRILLLEDGIRLNNSRRQSDFGELPGLVDIDTARRVEVVRGPASVLYGSDAIGGVVNIITTSPPVEPFGGRISFRYGTADDQGSTDLTVGGRSGRVGWQVTGGYRSTEAYKAPAGTFGAITLADDTLVGDTGVRDHNASARLSFYPREGSELFVKYGIYRAGETGFGFVDPAVYDPGAPNIRLFYPFQNFDQLTFGYRGTTLGRAWADSAEVTIYARDNDRDFRQDIFVPFGIPGFPDAGVKLFATNATNYETAGLRVEMRKAAGSRNVLTYGVDWYRDRSENEDFLETAIVGFGPPEIETDTSPRVPFATDRSAGFFVQDEVDVHRRLTMILGVRYQDTTARTEETPGLPPEVGVSSSDDAAVWAANFLFSASDNVKLVASAGSAFRSPNLIERFFDGPTPEGAAWQSRNLSLRPEKSLNYDVGLKYRRANVLFDATYFRNTVRDGIRIAPTGETVAELPEYRNINIDELRYQGVEVAFDWAIGAGFSLGTNYTRLRSRDVRSPIPIADSYSGKLVARVGYRRDDGRFWVDYLFRHSDEQDEAEIVDNPIGDVIPAFDVHLVRGGVELFRGAGSRHTLVAQVSNLTNELYSEVSNAEFFRPEPERSLTVSYGIDF